MQGADKLTVFTLLIQMCFEYGQIRKTSTTIHNPKSKKSREQSGLRLVPLTSLLTKVIEKLINNMVVTPIDAKLRHL